ncbi:hypothetical protein CASFOL_030919 [Castilleja foliolosa]|uniref:Peptidase A1 domain-containing protein n=1 Tax=Castilleja foliolosa TaxID=1961234 RepID=A0ABD3C9I0_9LAMI
MSNYFSFPFPSIALLISLFAFASLLDQAAGQRASVYASEGEFLVNLGFGTRPFVQPLFIDTDSDLMFIDQCKIVSLSYAKLNCSSQLCKTVVGSSCNTAVDFCQYKYQYSKAKVDLSTETITFDGNVKTTNLVFGCPTKGKDADIRGALGLGRGPLSLVSQLKANKFAYCLPSFDNPNKTGVVLFGDRVKTLSKMITARLLRNPISNPSSYYIEFLGISINNVLLNIPKSTFEINRTDGSGGLIVDTGSTMTYLSQSVFNEVAKEVDSQMDLTPATAFEDIGLPLCYNIPYNIEKDFKFPIITLHFNNQTKLELPLESTFREYTDKSTNQNISCLAMAAASPSDRGMSSLGNMQQQNTLVVYDLVKQTVSFRPNTKCDKM